MRPTFSPRLHSPDKGRLLPFPHPLWLPARGSVPEGTQKAGQGVLPWPGRFRIWELVLGGQGRAEEKSSERQKRRKYGNTKRQAEETE